MGTTIHPNTTAQKMKIEKGGIDKSGRATRGARKKETKEREKDRRNRSRLRDDEYDRRRHKSRREQFNSEDDEDRISRRRKGKRDESVSSASEDDNGWVGKDMPPPEDAILDTRLKEAANADLQRNSWMQAPSSLDVDYVQRKKKEEKSTYIRRHRRITK